jgi:hypothetical protein
MTLHGISLGEQPFEYVVPSETQAGRVWRVYTHLEPWKCTCPGNLKHHHCKHIEMVKEYLAEMEGGREREEEEPVTGMITPPPPTHNGLSKWTVTIHGKECIRYQGLLAMAHEQGLMHFGARFTEVTDKLATAWAWAHFKDGRKFYEAADATPENVHPGVQKAWMRMALTRAKARVLRDALNIGMVSVEELEE